MFLGVCIALVAIISFNLGKINALQKIPVKISDGANIYKAASIGRQETSKTDSQKGIGAIPKQQPNDTKVVVSKNSNKYHFSWCSGAKRIKLENQIWFNTAKEAEAKGYVLAGNCTP